MASQIYTCGSRPHDARRGISGYVTFTTLHTTDTFFECIQSWDVACAIAFDLSRNLRGAIGLELVYYHNCELFLDFADDIRCDVIHFDTRTAVKRLDIRTKVILSSGMDKKHVIRSPQDLGGLIAEARHERGQSQRELAAEFGVSQAWLSRVERGYQKTWLGQVFRLAVYLGVEMDARIGKSADAQRSAKAEAGGYPDLDQLV